MHIDRAFILKIIAGLLIFVFGYMSRYIWKKCNNPLEETAENIVYEIVPIPVDFTPEFPEVLYDFKETYA